ncbi:MAG: cyclic nucleotide-binding domain-containing protein [Treponema sp.]|nr:cyclic nucleotide-binding domain-containing protein [Treponema sp.]
MKKILTASNNPKIIDTVRNACVLYSSFFSADFCTETEDVIRFINYEMPELKVLDYSDGSIDCEKIMEAINSDDWLHYGGIIAVCKNRAQVELIEEKRDMNVLVVQTENEFVQHFTRVLRILYKNQHFLFNRGMKDVVGALESGAFVCGNDPMDMRFYTNFLVDYLYNSNRISKYERYNLQLTFTELLTNALEHGNLEISYQEKSDWLNNGGNMIELIEKKSKDPRYADRKIRISYSFAKNASKFIIHDDGNGFDWRAVQNAKAEECHGRGIAMSREVMKYLTYNEKGNEVTFYVQNQQNLSNSVPNIIRPFDTIDYNDKQIVFREGELSNDLYFIVSGRFAIYANNRLTTVLNPNDLFIGEMAFLLNDRRTATVMSVGHSRLIKVPKKDFLLLIRKNPHYGIFLSKMLAQRLVKQTKDTIDLKLKVNDLEKKVGNK